ncbi:hypothetical protein ACGFXC_09110 [Streptomyces sp. NPDC048507]
MTEPREPGHGNPYANCPPPAAAPPDDDGRGITTIGAIDDYEPGDEP